MAVGGNAGEDGGGIVEAQQLAKAETGIEMITGTSGAERFRHKRAFDERNFSAAGGEAPGEFGDRWQTSERFGTVALVNDVKGFVNETIQADESGHLADAIGGGEQSAGGMFAEFGSVQLENQKVRRIAAFSGLVRIDAEQLQNAL